MYIWIRENGRFCQSGKKHFLVRVGDALEAETIFDSTHAKIHIAALKGREKPKGGGEREGEREREKFAQNGESTCLQMFDAWLRRRDGREKLPISASSIFPGALPARTRPVI